MVRVAWERSASDAGVSADTGVWLTFLARGGVPVSPRL